MINNNADALITNALKMLKPGGYLHWDENDPNALSANLPDPTMEAPASKTIVALFLMMTKGHSRVMTDWLHALPKTLRERGCEVLEGGRVEAKPQLAKALTDNYLTVWKGGQCFLLGWRMVVLMAVDLTPNIPEAPMPLPQGMGLPESISRQSFTELLKKVVEETSKGVSLTMPFYITIARKAT